MSNIKLSLYLGNDQVEDSQLRSVLIFGDYAKQPDREKYLMQRTILSIIIQLNGRATFDSVRSILCEKFGLKVKNKEYNKYLQSLEEDKLISICDVKLIPITDNDEGDKYFEKLNSETENLIDGILRRYVALSKSNIVNQVSTIKNNIRRALSVYYKMSGLKFFNLQKGNPTSISAIDAAMEGMSIEDGKRLVAAIGDALKNPTDPEKRILNKWAKAYVVTQLLKIDPTLTSFKQERLKSKSFVVDTDVLLHALSSSTAYSKEYREILLYIRQLGCKIYIPKEVINDVKGHAEQAIQIVNEYGEEQIKQFDENVLCSSKLSNVFIEDFVNRVRNDENSHNLRFESYISNIYFPQDERVLMFCIGNIVGLQNLANELPKEDIDESVMDNLRELILDITQTSPKGLNRSEFFNTKVAEDDTRLYLTISSCNEKARKEKIFQESKLLPERIYFLTQSTKIERSARQLGIYKREIICHPESLAEAIKELGDIPTKEAEIINLFENPFLVYTADDIWSKIEPLIKEGDYIYHEDIQLLRAKVELKFDGMLACKNEEERIEYAKKYTREGFKFTRDMTKLAERAEKAEATNDAYLKIIKDLKQKIGEKKYRERIGGKGKKKNKRRKR